MPDAVERVLRRLGVADPRAVEIESKRRLAADRAEALHDHLAGLKGVRSAGRRVFFDRYLDTPDRALLRAGASLRLRTKNGRARVHLQYKGPGFRRDGLLYRSEFDAMIPPRALPILHAPPEMLDAMNRHLGPRVVRRIGPTPLVCAYIKDKFLVDLDDAELEPSVDLLCAFREGSFASFWEYENEIKAPDANLAAKLRRLDALLRFDARISRRFGLRPERHDKYHRCAAALGNPKSR